MGSLPDFSLPAEQAIFAGFLFDMDGTIIDSTNAVIKHWTSIGEELGVQPEVILETSHGRRSIDVLSVIAPQKATWEYVTQMEARIPQLYGDDAVEIPGARKLLAAVSRTSPWAIVTSGTKPLVAGWLDVLSLAAPGHLITAESVQQGKPDPAGYLLGLDALGLADRPGDVLVLEDSPAGIAAGKRAGCKVVGLVTSHSAKEVAAAGPDWVVEDLRSLRIVGGTDGAVAVEFVNALRRT